MSIFLVCLNPVPSIKAVENQICLFFGLSKFPLTMKSWLGQSDQSTCLHACVRGVIHLYNIHFLFSIAQVEILESYCCKFEFGFLHQLVL